MLENLIIRNIILILFVLLGFFINVSRADTSTEESEILVAEAQLAEADGHRSEALKIAEQAFQLNPDSVSAARLLVKCAQQQSRGDLIKKYGEAIHAAMNHERFRLWALEQFQKASERSADLDWSGSVEQIQPVVHQLQKQNNRLLPLLREAYYHLGLSYLQLNNLPRATFAFSAAGTEYRQQALFYSGLSYYQTGYFHEALDFFSQAAAWPPTSENALIRQSSKEWVGVLENDSLELLGFLMAGYDSNPFGFPADSIFDDGTLNRSGQATLGLNLAYRGPMSKDKACYFRVGLGFMHTQAVGSGASINLLNAEQVTGSATVYLSDLNWGRLSGTYTYSFRQTQQDTSWAWNEYRIDSNIHAFILNYIINPVAGFEWDITYSFSDKIYGSFTDMGSYDRTGTVHALAIGARQYFSRFLKPSLTFAGAIESAQGNSISNQFLSATLSNTFQKVFDHIALVPYLLGKWTQFPDYSGGRIDLEGDLGVSIEYPMRSKVTLFGSTQYSQIFSSQDFYTQNRINASIGAYFQY